MMYKGHCSSRALGQRVSGFDSRGGVALKLAAFGNRQFLSGIRLHLIGDIEWMHCPGDEQLYKD